MRQRLITLGLIAVLLPRPALAQRKFELTVDQIMRGPGLVGYEPTGVRWSQDGRRVYFRWKRADEPRLKESDLYVVARDGSGLRRLTEEEAKLAPPAGGDLSQDRRRTVFAEDGDLFLYDHERGERRQLTRTVDGESNPRFTRDQKHVTFTRQNNLYQLALDGGELIQLTDIRTGGAAEPAGARSGSGGPPRQGGGTAATPPQRGTESQEYLKREERELIEAVRERAKLREEQEAKRKQRERRQPFNLPPGQSPANLTPSPGGKYVSVTVVQSASGAKNTIVPNYVTESAYTEDLPARTKVGDAQGRTRLAIVEVETGAVRWVEHGIRAENEKQEGQTREVQFSPIQWSEDGERAVLFARAADNKDRWVLALDPATGKTKVLDQIRDEAWVGGPGASTLGWLPDQRQVYFESERDGFAHLYSVATDGGPGRQLTSGRFEVSEVRLARDKSKFYFTSSEGSFFERHLYSMPITGGARTRITALPGQNEAVISPDEEMLALVRSYSNQPPELYLAPNRPGAEAKRVTTSPTAEFLSSKWIDPPIVNFKARDGATVYARLYKPPGFRRGGPAVLFVHGAGYLQNVHKWWSSYFREYMFHHLLMERGFLVLDIDYRGSAGYGRDWRTGIHRHMGGKDLTDHIDAARYLVAEHGVEAQRIGIYGGSYGGFITLMAMFTAPEVFAAGAALRPVTDWAHYNHSYTANILNLPQADVEAYQRSSPIYFAEGLKGALLICHGMVDVNVHFQDTVRLVQRLIELRKENWELAVYPVEDHGFVQPSSWADEYRRILKLFLKLHPGESASPAPASGRRR